MNGLNLDSIRKDAIVLFKEEWLSTIIETNFNKTHFLDITFNVQQKKKYFSFQKANNTPLYINALSKHSPTIIKQFPKTVSKRISDLSCNKEEFDQAKSVYQTSPKVKWSFPSISFNNSNTQNAQKTETMFMWLNSPYC